MLEFIRSTRAVIVLAIISSVERVYCRRFKVESRRHGVDDFVRLSLCVRLSTCTLDSSRMRCVFREHCTTRGGEQNTNRV